MKLSTCLFVLLCRASTASAGADYSVVEGKDGVPLAIAESGNPQGQTLLFIHGGSQSSLAWKYQLNDPELRERFRMLALDLRGHGASGKPWAQDAYDGKTFASDMHAIITAKRLVRPVLIAWSYGGAVAMAYFRAHGTANIGGLVLVGAVTFLDGPAERISNPSKQAVFDNMIERMNSADSIANLEATRQFVTLLTARRLSAADEEETWVGNMLTPAYVRRALIEGAKHYDNSDMKLGKDLPTLIIQGEKDTLVPRRVSRANQAAIQGARLVLYSETGHMPFIEDVMRFNRDLAQFAAECATLHR